MGVGRGGGGDGTFAQWSWVLDLRETIMKRKRSYGPPSGQSVNEPFLLFTLTLCVVIPGCGPQKVPQRIVSTSQWANLGQFKRLLISPEGKELTEAKIFDLEGRGFESYLKSR